MEDAESIIKMLELDAFVSGEKKTNSELAIEKWIYSELENPSNAKDRKEFFNASKYKSYIVSNNEKVKYVFDNFMVIKFVIHICEVSHKFSLY